MSFSPPSYASDPNQPAIDSATAAFPIPEDACGHRWTLPTRIGFRFAFCYFGSYCIFNGNDTVWNCIPYFGESIGDVLARVFLLPAQFLARHLFSIGPPGDTLHPTGSGDTAIHWIVVLLLLVSSLLATAIWTALDRRRPNYQTLAAWLRFLIRLTLALGMVGYGMAKVFPLQMALPSIGSLSEPLGMHSPMALLWSFIGVNPWYERICGSAELLAGLLLLFRRTALAGALFTAFVASNILLYNLCFDVPVKIYSGHLLLLSLFAILPDARALFGFFWLHRPTRPTGVWVPPSTRRGFLRATVAVEIAFAVMAVGGSLLVAVRDWRDTVSQQDAQCSLCGDWHIDTANLIDAAGHIVPHFPQVATGHAASEFIIDSATRGMLRDTSGNSVYLQLKIDNKAYTVEVDIPGALKIVYAVHSTDAAHLILTPVGDAAKAHAGLGLSQLTPPKGYPLLHRGFHWVSEYPYQR